MPLTYIFHSIDEPLIPISIPFHQTARRLETFWPFYFWNVNFTIKVYIKPESLANLQKKFYKCSVYCIWGAHTQKKFRTHVIKLEIAPMSFPPGQYLLVSASNNMLYYLSQEIKFAQLVLLIWCHKTQSSDSSK